MCQELERAQANALFGVSAEIVAVFVDGLEVGFSAGIETPSGLAGDEEFEETGELPRVETQQRRGRQKREQRVEC